MLRRRVASAEECAELMQAAVTAAQPKPKEDLSLYGRGRRGMAVAAPEVPKLHVTAICKRQPSCPKLAGSSSKPDAVAGNQTTVGRANQATTTSTPVSTCDAPKQQADSSCCTVAGQQQQRLMWTGSAVTTSSSHVSKGQECETGLPSVTTLSADHDQQAESTTVGHAGQVHRAAGTAAGTAVDTVVGTIVDTVVQGNQVVPAKRSHGQSDSAVAIASVASAAVAVTETVSACCLPNAKRRKISGPGDVSSSNSMSAQRPSPPGVAANKQADPKGTITKPTAGLSTTMQQDRYAHGKQQLIVDNAAVQRKPLVPSASVVNIHHQTLSPATLLTSAVHNTAATQLPQLLAEHAAEGVSQSFAAVKVMQMKQCHQQDLAVKIHSSVQALLLHPTNSTSVSAAPLGVQCVDHATGPGRWEEVALSRIAPADDSLFECLWAAPAGATPAGLVSPC